jgi:hypothetical protein
MVFYGILLIIKKKFFNINKIKNIKMEVYIRVKNVLKKKKENEEYQLVRWLFHLVNDDEIQVNQYKSSSRPSSRGKKMSARHELWNITPEDRGACMTGNYKSNHINIKLMEKYSSIVSFYFDFRFGFFHRDGNIHIYPYRSFRYKGILQSDCVENCFRNIWRNLCEHDQGFNEDEFKEPWGEECHRKWCSYLEKIFPMMERKTNMLVPSLNLIDQFISYFPLKKGVLQVFRSGSKVIFTFKDLRFELNVSERHMMFFVVI